VKRCKTLFSGLVIAACARAAQAADGCSGDEPWVAVAGDLPPAFADAVRSDLRAGLAPSRIEVCAERGSDIHQALARVFIEQLGANGVRYKLEVTDSVTRKRVERQLSLERLPPDGRAFALAVAAEELLRASWAELALRGVHSAESAAPPEVRAIVADAERPRPRSPRYVALGARLAFEHFTGGQTHYGADLFAALPVGRVAAGLIALGARRALSVRAPHGDIGAQALSVELGVSVMVLRRGGLELGAFVSERLLRLSFEPEAEAGAVADASHGFAVTSRCGLALAFGSPGLLRSYSALGAGLPLKSFSAADGGKIVTGASELELFASSGLALELP
jgi:hypothetical protein